MALTVIVREAIFACLMNLPVLRGLAPALVLVLRLLLPLLIPLSLVLYGTLKVVVILVISSALSTPLLKLSPELLTTIEAQFVRTVRTVSLKSSLRLRRRYIGMEVPVVLVVMTVVQALIALHPIAEGAARTTIGVPSLLVVRTTVPITLTPLVPNVFIVHLFPRVPNSTLPDAISGTTPLLPELQLPRPPRTTPLPDLEIEMPLPEPTTVSYMPLANYKTPTTHRKTPFRKED